MATAIAEPPHLTADLKALYLSTVASQWRPLAEQAARQRQAPADYLAQLVHLEVTGRRERRIQRRIQDARFPMLKTLDAFSFEAQPDLDRDAVLQVFDCRFVAEAANVVFVGGVGTGKTHLSIALGMACCQHDYRVRFVTAAELVTLLVEAQQQGRLARKLAQLARFDLVICDELGYVPLDKAGADLLFGFISQRYERRSLGCRATTEVFVYRVIQRECGLKTVRNRECQGSRRGDLGWTVGFTRIVSMVTVRQ